MTKIKNYVEKINEELSGAKEYAEKYVEYKAMDDTMRSTKYKEMATQELQHAMNIHDFAVKDIEILKSVYPQVPQDMLEKWEKAHKEYVDKAAWIKQMLSM